jgi:hypothetical protein
MTLRNVFLFAAAPLVAVSFAAGCDSGDCENTGSCGEFPSAGKAGSSAGGSGKAGSGGATGGDGTAGSQGGTGAETGGVAGTGGGTAGDAGTAGSGATSGSGGSGGATGGDGGTSSGASGASGAAGAGGEEPCGGDCTGETPVCDEDAETCVECLTGEHCDGETPACDVSTKTCVECTAEDTAACVGEAPICDTEEQTCVGCLENTTCTEATASRCAQGTQTCVACSESAECTHIAGKGVCDAGTCVECTATDETACGENSCNPATNECTETPRGSVGTCLPCLADSECLGSDQEPPSLRCVPMHFQSVSRTGGFCLRRDAGVCEPPFVVRITAVSLSGAAEEPYCGIDMLSTSCEAIVDLASSQTCNDGMATSCGCMRDLAGTCIGQGQGGLCETTSLGSNRCTYPCDVPEQCLGIFTCTLDKPFCH